MRDIDDPLVRSVIEKAASYMLRDTVPLFAIVQSAFGEIESWRHVKDGLAYNLEAGGDVLIRIQVETEGV